MTEDNPVRVIDVFIDELDLGTFGFARVVPEATGRPAYHPAEKRNIGLMWLTLPVTFAAELRKQ